MVDAEIKVRLYEAFPKSFVNYNGEFIAHEKANQYFILRTCETELDVKCKVLEWFSRAAHKTEPFNSARENRRLHKFMLEGINTFLGTNFTEDDMNIIYTYLGNACNHLRTLDFVNSGYDMTVLERRSEDG